MDYTREQISKQFDNLTPELKKIIATLDMAGLIDSLHKEYGLHLDQLGVLATEITMVLVGLSPSTSFRDRLKKKVGIAEDVANLITYKLNQQIFSKIRQELIKSTQQGIKDNVGDSNNNDSSAKTFDSKMSGVANVPKQEVEVKAQTEDNKVEEIPAKPPRDPYRELIK